MLYIKEIIFLLVLAICTIKLGPMMIALWEMYKAQWDLEHNSTETEAAKKELEKLIAKYRKRIFKVELSAIFKIFLFFGLIRITFYLCYQ